MKKITIEIPEPLYERLENIEKKLGLTKEDIVARALLKAIEEFEK